MKKICFILILLVSFPVYANSWNLKDTKEVYEGNDYEVGFMLNLVIPSLFVEVHVNEKHAIRLSGVYYKYQDTSEDFLLAELAYLFTIHSSKKARFYTPISAVFWKYEGDEEYKEGIMHWGIGLGYRYRFATQMEFIAEMQQFFLKRENHFVTFPATRVGFSVGF